VSEGRPAVFLDRDGVLNELVHTPTRGARESPRRASDVRLIAGAAAAAAALKAAGYVLVCATNQPGAAKAEVSLGELEAIHERVRELLAAEGVELDSWKVCLHHPDGVLPDLGRPCACRKPEPGMLLDAARDLGLELSRSWMIGDSSSDVAAARAAGCRSILIENPHSAHKRADAPDADLNASDLRDAAAQLLALERC
jgi:D-glycero-D-manno-heptose 1,7-bisphosphate phosphatase